MMHRGFKVFINWDDHNPPHFHVEYGGDEMLVRIEDAEPMAGDLPAEQKKELFQIDPNVDSSVVWNNRIDFCRDACYLNSTPV